MLRGEGRTGVWTWFFSGEGKGSEKGELELHRYPDSDVRCDESLRDSRRAVSEGQIWAGQVMVKGLEVLASVCSGEDEAEPVPLWAVCGEHDRMWLWDCLVLCLGYWAVPEEVGALHGSCCVPGDRELKLPCIQIFLSFFSTPVISSLL